MRQNLSICEILVEEIAIKAYMNLETIIVSY